MGPLRHPGAILDHLHANEGIVRLILGDASDFGLDELNPHGPGVLEELLVSLSEGPDIHVVDGDIHERERTG